MYILHFFIYMSAITSFILCILLHIAYRWFIYITNLLKVY